MHIAAALEYDVGMLNVLGPLMFAVLLSPALVLYGFACYYLVQPRVTTRFYFALLTAESLAIAASKFLADSSATLN